MQKLAILGARTALLALLAPTARTEDADGVVRLRTENELLKKGAEPDRDQPVGAAKVTIDDVDYEVVSLKANGEKATPRLAVTSKEGNRTFPLVMRRYHLIAADGTLNTSVALVLTGQSESPLLEGVRVVMPVTFDRGPCPASMKMITAIQLGTRLAQNPQAHPVILKGNSPVEGRYSSMRETVSCPATDEYLRLASGLTPPPEAERLLTHLEACQGCARVVDALPEADNLVELIRQASSWKDSTASATVAQLIDQLSRLRPDAPTQQAAGQSDQQPTGSLPEAGKAHQRALCAFLAPPQSPDELGRLGPYRVLQVLGFGGMGVVFRAHDPHLDRIVALKVMVPAMASRDGARQRFLREARATAAIKHDHIVSVYQVGEDRGVPFLAMEFLEGETLDARLKREGKLPVAEVLRIGREMTQGLAAAHKRALIHRDIKPANVWLEADSDRVKILDFGLVRAAGEQGQLTQEGAIVGTPAYMAPEQARGRGVDQRCDLFSLGCVLYQMATGAQPFRGTDVVSTLLAVSTHTPPPPSRVEAALSPALSDLIMDLLAKDPADRPSSSQVVAETLEQIARTPATKLAATKPATRRRWPIRLGVAICLLLTVLAMLWHGGAVRLNTTDGTIVLEDLPADAEVLVDGATAKVKYGPDGKWIEVQIAPGERKLVIKAPGFQAKTQDVTLSTGERKPIRIRLEPLAMESPEVTTKPTVSNDGWSGWPTDAPPPANAPFNSEQAKKHQEAWAKYLNVPEECTNSIGMRFCLIPPGEFTMGSTAAEIDAARPLLYTRVDPARPERVLAEGPQRRVMLTKPFYLGAHEVTQRHYERVSGKNPSIFSATGAGRDRVAGRDTADLPVENVTWFDVTSLCNLLSKAEQLPAAYHITAISTTSIAGAGYRLPTEAEWEYACRAGTSTLFWSGDDEASLMKAGWYGANNTSDGLKIVGTRAANPFGLYDVHGNVWEWVNDGWDPVFYQRLVGPAARDPRSEIAVDGRHVIRGGDFFMSAAECRSACRDGYHANDHYDDLGFRLALSVEAVRKMKGAAPLKSVKP